MSRCAACNKEAIEGDVYCEDCISTKERSRTSLKYEIRVSEQREQKEQLRAARLRELLDPMIWAGKLMAGIGTAVIMSGVVGLMGAVIEVSGCAKQILPGTPDNIVILSIGIGSFMIAFIGLVILGLYDPHGW